MHYLARHDISKTYVRVYLRNVYSPLASLASSPSASITTTLSTMIGGYKHKIQNVLEYMIRNYRKKQKIHR